MQRFRNILCVIEHGDASQPALNRAVALAENNQAKLTVVDVVPRITAGIGLLDDGSLSHDLQKAMVREHEAQMESLIDPYRQRLDIQRKVLLGTSFLEVIREVLHNEYDLVIKCPESPDWLDRLFAGDDMHLLRKCPCPVWLIKPHAPRSYKRILAAVDVGNLHLQQEGQANHQLNMQILEMAASLALTEFAELHVVHVWESMSELVSGLVFSSDLSDKTIAANIYKERLYHQQLLEELIRNTKVKSHSTQDLLDYLSPKTHLLKGSARKEIPVLAKRLDIDCVVMGTVARTGISGFIMGNTAETILEQIDCSVLAIKPPGFVTPVTLE